MADYNGDGRIDLISGSSCCQPDPYLFYVFLRKEDGRFAERRKIVVAYPEIDSVTRLDSVNGLRSKVAAADWNGDGHTDVVIGGDTSALAVAWGPLAGKDKLQVDFVWPLDDPPFLRMVTNPCLADWDGDGSADLIVGGQKTRDSARQIYVFRNEGTAKLPRLAEPQPLLSDIPKSIYTTGISVADWNGDGHQDLIASRAEHDNQAKSVRHRVWVYLRKSE